MPVYADNRPHHCMSYDRPYTCAFRPSPAAVNTQASSLLRNQATDAHEWASSIIINETMCTHSFEWYCQNKLSTKSIATTTNHSVSSEAIDISDEHDIGDRDTKNGPAQALVVMLAFDSGFLLFQQPTHPSKLRFQVTKAILKRFVWCII